MALCPPLAGPVLGMLCLVLPFPAWDPKLSSWPFPQGPTLPVQPGQLSGQTPILAPHGLFTSTVTGDPFSWVHLHPVVVGSSVLQNILFVAVGTLAIPQPWCPCCQSPFGCHCPPFTHFSSQGLYLPNHPATYTRLAHTPHLHNQKQICFNRHQNSRQDQNGRVQYARSVDRACCTTRRRVLQPSDARGRLGRRHGALAL